MCNLEYILATAHSSTIHNLINRLQLTVTQVLDIDLYLILRCITSAEAVLQFDPLQLASEIIGRLRQLKGISHFLLSFSYLHCLPKGVIPISRYIMDMLKNVWQKVAKLQSFENATVITCTQIYLLIFQTKCPCSGITIKFINSCLHRMPNRSATKYYGVTDNL